MIETASKEHPDIILKCSPPIGVPLQVEGVLKERDREGIAIVGSRKPSLYGIRLADKIAKASVESGRTVISGLARGIDTESHRSALKNGGRTIAVLGSGIDTIYPEENIGLAEEIKKNGAVISQFPDGTPPLRKNFPIRNMTVAKLCSVLVVVQASLRSGSLLTARLARESGKKVFIIPGEIDDEQFAGNIRFLEKYRDDPLVEPLLNVEQLKEFIADLPSGKESFNSSSGNIFQDLDEHESKVVKLIMSCPEGMDFDTLSFESNFSSAELPSILLSLVMRNLIMEVPGKIFQFTGDMK